MEPFIKRSLHHSYLIFRSGQTGASYPFESAMLQRNRIPSLLPMTAERIDEQTSYAFEITSLQSLSVYCRSRKIGRDDLTNILGSVLYALQSLEDFLLDAGHLVLRPDSIYLNWETQALFFAYVPGFAGRIRESMQALLEYILTQISHEDQGTVVLAYRILHELQEEHTQLGDLMKYLVKDGSAPAAPGHGSFSLRPEPKGNAENRSVFDEAFPPAPDLHDDEGTPALEVDGSPALHPAVKVILAGIPSFALISLLLHIYHTGYLRMPELIGGLLLLAVLVFLSVFHFSGKRAKKESTDTPSFLTVKDEDSSSPPQPYPDIPDSPLHTISTFPDPEMPYEESLPDLHDFFSNPEMLMEDNNAEPDGAPTVLLTEPHPMVRRTARLVPVGADSSCPSCILGSGDLLIGSMAGTVGLHLTDRTVSRIHARITRKDGQYYLMDLNSRNGTTVNGRTLLGEEEIALTDGMQLAFAGSRYLYRES